MTLISLWMKGLTPDIVKKAEKDLGETEEIRAQSLKDLRRLINGEKDFRPRLDDAFLLRFLRCKKFNVDIAFNNLKNYYTFKVRYSGLITDFKPSQIEHILESDVIYPLPWRLPDGSGAGILRLGHFDIKSGTAEDVFAACLVCLEVVLENEATQVCGGSIVIDLNKFGLRHLRHFASPTFLFRLVRLVQDCIPLRIKGFHVVNEPFFISATFSVIKQLLSEKMKNRIHFHGSNLKSLHKIIPAELLPDELGGSLGPVDNTEFRKQVLNRESYFEKINKYGFQEKRAQFIRKKSSRSMGLFL